MATGYDAERGAARAPNVTSPGAAGLPTPAPAASATAVSAPASSAERRQLTVLFCDLVGSTALSRQLDPEDLREVIGAYHRCVAEAVTRLGGFVAKYMGDGVLAYFGYPQAHEDDAERAVRTGLALIEAVGQLQAPDRLRVRIGIDTGLVVVGDLIGSGEAQERGIVGETPNLAARLQTLADPGTVVIGPQTRQHRRLPALLIATFRPEFHPPWVGQPHVTVMTLSRLDQRERAALVERVIGNKVLPAQVVNEIVERTDGVPLFLEELTKAVLEVGGDGCPPTGALAATSTAARAVPTTLHASLMARLDHLGPGAKAVAQIGAAIGREFAYELLHAVGHRSDAELQAALGQLVEAGLAFCRGVPPQATYLFKHTASARCLRVFAWARLRAP
jgi:class 3 adenylate cyclase